MNSKPRKILFAHDGPLFKDREGNYYGIHITEKLKKRYLYLGDELTAIMRVKTIDDQDTKKYSAISPENFNVIGVDNFKKFPQYFIEKRKVEKLAEKAVIEHDVVVARIPSMIGSMVIKYAKKHNKPLLCEFVACGWDALWNHSLKGKIVAPYFFLKQRERMKNMPHVIYVTEKFLQGRYPTTGKTTNCSNVELGQIDEAVLQKRLERIEARDSSRPLVLGTVAAIDVLYKGQEDVIAALAVLKKKNINFEYKLVGQGNPAYLQGKIKKYGLEDRVTIIGPLKHDEVFGFLDSIDIYIQPSKQEGLPRAVIEAMSRACPVMGAHTGGIPELIDHKYIFPKAGVKDIVGLLSSIDKEEMRRLAGENFEKSKEYTADILLQRRFKFYNLFLEDNGLPNTNDLK